MPVARHLNHLLGSLLLFSLSCGAQTSGVPFADRTASPSDAMLAARAALPEADAPRDWSVGEIAAALKGLHTGLLPAEIAHVSKVIEREARRAHFSPALVLAVIRIESSGYTFAKSHKGALGLMQLLPTTGAYVAGRIRVPWEGPESLYDASTNVRLGIAYLRQLVNRYGSIHTALAAYNWGPTRISSRLQRGKSVPAVYADRVLAAFGQMQARPA